MEEKTIKFEATEVTVEPCSGSYNCGRVMVSLTARPIDIICTVVGEFGIAEVIENMSDNDILKCLDPDVIKEYAEDL